MTRKKRPKGKGRQRPSDSRDSRGPEPLPFPGLPEAPKEVPDADVRDFLKDNPGVFAEVADAVAEWRREFVRRTGREPEEQDFLEEVDRMFNEMLGEDFPEEDFLESLFGDDLEDVEDDEEDGR